MADITVTTEDLEALAAKLESVDLTPKEREALAAVFALAGGSLADEVQGFAFDAFRPGLNLSLNFSGPGDEGPEERGILIGLLKNPGTLNVRKAGKDQQTF